MELAEAIRGRRSIRKFTGEPVAQDLIQELISLALYAPTPGNQQMWGFHVVLSRSSKEEMAAAVIEALKRIAAEAGKEEDWLAWSRRAATFFVHAPVVIAVSTVRYRSRVDEALEIAGYKQDEIDDLRCRPDLQGVGAAVQNLLLAAYEKGLGACWMTGPMAARRQLEKILGVVPPRTLAALVALGYPAQHPGEKKVKDFVEVVKFIR